ncbi:unnamed protein product [Psylliodes chrysocephalus]|uniref:Uncharacterized protein n=1 Tax=Psylliodes chrysocephalus TaxID=3402493 RepID=A0A9P0CUZ1_9CUCU|nr:unnamed protein product [Psylliodes chrysocephala]
MRLLNEEFHRQAIWLMANHHGLNWNHGFTPLHEFHNIIQNVTKNVEAVYVKGREKAQYIRKYSLAPVFEMDEHPALPKLPPKCPHHLILTCINDNLIVLVLVHPHGFATLVYCSVQNKEAGSPPQNLSWLQLVIYAKTSTIPKE